MYKFDDFLNRNTVTVSDFYKRSKKSTIGLSDYSKYSLNL